MDKESFCSLNISEFYCYSWLNKQLRNACLQLVWYFGKIQKLMYKEIGIMFAVCNVQCMQNLSFAQMSFMLHSTRCSNDLHRLRVSTSKRCYVDRLDQYFALSTYLIWASCLNHLDSVFVYRASKRQFSWKKGSAVQAAAVERVMGLWEPAAELACIVRVRVWFSSVLAVLPLQTSHLKGQKFEALWVERAWRASERDKRASVAQNITKIWNQRLPLWVK